MSATIGHLLNLSRFVKHSKHLPPRRYQTLLNTPITERQLINQLTLDLTQTLNPIKSTDFKSSSEEELPEENQEPPSYPLDDPPHDPSHNPLEEKFEPTSNLEQESTHEPPYETPHDSRHEKQEDNQNLEHDPLHEEEDDLSSFVIVDEGEKENNEFEKQENEEYENEEHKKQENEDEFGKQENEEEEKYENEKLEYENEEGEKQEYENEEEEKEEGENEDDEKFEDDEDENEEEIELFYEESPQNVFKTRDAIEILEFFNKINDDAEIWASITRIKILKESFTNIIIDLSKNLDINLQAENLQMPTNLQEPINTKDFVDTIKLFQHYNSVEAFHTKENDELLEKVMSLTPRQAIPLINQIKQLLWEDVGNIQKLTTPRRPLSEQQGEEQRGGAITSEPPPLKDVSDEQLAESFINAYSVKFNVTGPSIPKQQLKKGVALFKAHLIRNNLPIEKYLDEDFFELIWPTNSREIPAELKDCEFGISLIRQSLEPTQPQLDSL